MLLYGTDWYEEVYSDLMQRYKRVWVYESCDGELSYARRSEADIEHEVIVPHHWRFEQDMESGVVLRDLCGATVTAEQLWHEARFSPSRFLAKPIE